MPLSSVPVVSVIIATYNWSTVLRYAIESVLGQTYRDFEVLVIGDGCTDESAEVTASFGDERIVWHNLPANTGSQAGPNNYGLSLARGRLAAYLSHDDLWMPRHLENLVAAVENAGADVAYSMGVMIGPPGSPVRIVTGVSKSGGYEPEMLIPPSSFLHRTTMVDDSGLWQDYRTLHTPPDLAFLSAAWAVKKKFVATGQVTMFKFPAPWRKDAYKLRLCDEQQDYLRRIREQPDFLVQELTAVVNYCAAGPPESPVAYAEPPANAAPGWQIEQWRAGKGLPPGTGEHFSKPLYLEPAALRARNERADIVPAEGLDILYRGNELPPDAVFLGRGWYGLESAGPDVFRWLHTDGELIFTGLTGARSRLVMEAESGPSLGCEPIELRLVDEAGKEVAAATLSWRHEVSLLMPPLRCAGATFRLVAPPGGVRVGADVRTLNLRVFQIRLEA